MAYQEKLWLEAEKSCRLPTEEIGMANFLPKLGMGFNPGSLIKNIYGKNQNRNAPEMDRDKDRDEDKLQNCSSRTQTVERSILIFPDLIQKETIDTIRSRFDPLASLIKPHITLVFPFKSSYKKEEIETFAKQQLTGVSPFRLCLHGVCKYQENGEHYLFVQIQDGEEEIRQLHDILYQGFMAEFKKDIPYIPHMTVGKLSSAEELERAWELVKDKELHFQTNVEHICVERIGEQGESIIETEISLTQ